MARLYLPETANILRTHPGTSAVMESTRAVALSVSNDMGKKVRVTILSPALN
jgi:hypothetical protein